LQVAARGFAIDSFERFREEIACGVSTGLAIARDPVRPRDVARLRINRATSRQADVPGCEVRRRTSGCNFDSISDRLAFAAVEAI